jgi:hypothetical protein
LIGLLCGYCDFYRTQTVFPGNARRAVAQNGVDKVDGLGQVGFPEAGEEVIL